MLEEDFRLRVFVTVARLGSFSAAARELGVSQPAVSQNISELERQIGDKLFERTRNDFSITPKGTLLKKYAEQILHCYGIAAQSMESGTEVEPPAEVALSKDVRAQIWSFDGDIHIKLKQD